MRAYDATFGATLGQSVRFRFPPHPQEGDAAKRY